MAKQIPFDEIVKKAEHYKKDMTRFLRDMVAIPSESCDEKRVIHRIKEEMEKVGFDKVDIDPMGNILGYIGHGPHLIAMDAHIDTVGIGNIKNWEFDPYEGMENDEIIGGRGTSDQEGGMASMVYAGKIIKDLGLEDQYTLLVTGLFRKKTVTVCAGSTSSSRTKSDRNSWSVPNRLTARFTAASAAVWKSALMFRGSAATAPHRSAVITQSSKWVRFWANCRSCQNVWHTTISSARVH